MTELIHRLNVTCRCDSDFVHDVTRTGIRVLRRVHHELCPITTYIAEHDTSPPVIPNQLTRKPTW